jgi:Flp pilus assembly protein TadB
MPNSDPAGSEPAAERGARAFLRRNLAPAAGIGLLMGLVAAKEGSGIGVAVVVAVVGCGLVLGMLALKRGLTGS